MSVHMIGSPFLNFWLRNTYNFLLLFLNTSLSYQGRKFAFGNFPKQNTAKNQHEMQKNWFSLNYFFNENQVSIHELVNQAKILKKFQDIFKEFAIPVYLWHQSCYPFKQTFPRAICD